MLVEKAPGVSEVRENTRGKLAHWVVGAYLTFILLLIFPWLYRDPDIDKLIDLLMAVSSVTAGIVGAVVGFYFRSEEAEE